MVNRCRSICFMPTHQHCISHMATSWRNYSLYNWKRRIPLCILIAVWNPVDWLPRKGHKCRVLKIRFNEINWFRLQVDILWYVFGALTAIIQQNTFLFSVKMKTFVLNCLQLLTSQVGCPVVQSTKSAREIHIDSERV